MLTCWQCITSSGSCEHPLGQWESQIANVNVYISSFLSKIVFKLWILDTFDNFTSSFPVFKEIAQVGYYIAGYVLFGF